LVLLFGIFLIFYGFICFYFSISLDKNYLTLKKLF